MRTKKDKYTKPIHNKKSQHNRSKSHHSILQKHETRLQEFKKKDERIKTLNNKIKTLNTTLNKIKKESTNNYEKECQIYKIESQIEQETSTVKLIESGQDEIEYLLEASPLIMEYINLDDKEQILLNESNPSNDVVNEIRSKKAHLVDEYLSKFDPNYTGTTIQYDTIYCKSCNVNFTIDSGFFVCPSCGICSTVIDSQTELSYKELQDYDYRPQFCYEKASHLADWLRRFQAKENRAIPQDVIDKVLLEAKKERIQDLSTLTEDKVKRYLKKLDLNEFYDNIIGIINRINGRPPFTLTTEVEEKIKTMFQQIQEPYEKYKPKNRKNFLSYSYTLCQLFKILGLHEFAKYFPLLKSSDKLRQQDEIFKKIVAHMAEKDKTTKWVFYPTV
jgi:hypothetical protein